MKTKMKKHEGDMQWKENKTQNREKDGHEMSDTETKEKDATNPEDAEDDYIEDEDEDFQPEGEKSGDGSDDEDDDDDDNNNNNNNNNRDRDNARGKVDYSRIESESGGLVKTRRARQEEEEYARTHKYEALAVESIPAKVDSIWEELQRASRDRLSSRAGEVGSVLGSEASAATATATAAATATTVSAPSTESQSQWQEDKILIERSYKFAGETVHEKKWVARSSAEGQEHLNSLKFK
ncbi:Swc5p, partial [Saccharomyces eubayanus]|uniref:Swc5p n=1 Tax=Saccharomyces eubayanus TaxID=1080349 RepID=UPI0006BFFE2E